MHITSIHIENLKCLRGTHQIALPQRPDGSYAGWIVLAGRNGSGKTTLLKEIGAVAGGGLLGVQIGLMKSLYSEQDIHKTFIGVNPSSVDLPSKDLGRYLIHQWAVAGSQYSSPKPEARRAISMLPEVMRASWTIRERGWFLAAWGAHRYIGPYNPIDDDLAKDEDLASISHLFMKNPTLVNAVEWLQQLRFRELEEDREAGALLKRALALVNDGLVPDGVRLVRVSSQGVFALRAGGGEELMQGLAAGYATVTALVLDLLRHLQRCFGAEVFEASWEGTACGLPGVVLIDEVEAHLHVSWQQRLGPWLLAHFPQLQFIVTTHSPFICQSASPGGLIRLPAPGTDQRLEVVSEATHRAVVHGDVSSAVMSELFGLEHAHSPATEQIYRRLGELERKLQRGATLDDGERAEWEALNEALPQDMGSVAERELRMLSARLRDAQDDARRVDAKDAKVPGAADQAGPRRPRSRKKGGEPLEEEG